MVYYPSFSDIQSQFPQTKKDLDHIVSNFYKLENQLNNSKNDNSNSNLTLDNIRKALESSGINPINVQSLLGKLSEPQLAGVPRYSSLPSTSDPNIQDTSLFVLTTNNHLYYVNGASEPVSFIDLSAAVGSVTSVAISVPIELNVTGSPITTSGTFVITSNDSINITTVTRNANSTSDQNLMSYIVPAGNLNLGARTLRVTGSGIYTTQAGQTPTITFKIKFGSTVLATVVSANTTASSTDSQFWFEFFIITSSTGASGAVVVKGRLSFNDTNNPLDGNPKLYHDINILPISPIDLTGALTLQITAQFSTQPGTPFNSISQELLIVEFVGN